MTADHPQLGEHEEEEHAWQRVISLDPTNAAAFNNLGALYQNVRRDFGKAKEAYRKAIELKHAQACWNMSVLLEESSQDLDGAIDAAKLYIRAGAPDGDGEQRLAQLQALKREARAGQASPGRAHAVPGLFGGPLGAPAAAM